MRHLVLFTLLAGCEPIRPFASGDLFALGLGVWLGFFADDKLWRRRLRRRREEWRQRGDGALQDDYHRTAALCHVQADALSVVLGDELADPSWRVVWERTEAVPTAEVRARTRFLTLMRNQ